MKKDEVYDILVLEVRLDMSRKCFHQWAKVDEDDVFTKKGDKLVKEVKEKCINCGKERVREIKRRL